MSLVWHIRSSERGTETFGHWSDTVDRQRRSTEKFGHWMDTVDRQRGGSGINSYSNSRSLEMPPSQVLVISNPSLHNGRLTSDQTSLTTLETLYRPANAKVKMRACFSM